jgi:hypothetical protein
VSMLASGAEPKPKVKTVGARDLVRSNRSSVSNAFTMRFLRG